jgi:hypothetical protein
MNLQDMDEVIEHEEMYGPGVWKDGYYFHPLYLRTHKGVSEALTSGLIEGVPFKVTGPGEDIQPGDTYIAERNEGLKLLTCKHNNVKDYWIEPVENAYSYDTGECFRIELVVD